jgi:hypothetical protein
MWPYLLLFLVPTYLAMTQLRPTPLLTKNAKHDRWNFKWLGIFILLVLMIGWRHEVGGDWFNYIDNMENPEMIAEFGDPANKLLFWLGVNLGGGIYLVNLISAILFSWGLLVFCREQTRPWLALTVAIPYLVIVVAMGYTRQGVAIGLAMLGIVGLSRGRPMKFIMWIALAATFHKSAVILVPLAALANTKRRIFTLLWVVVAGIVLFSLLLSEALDSMISGYIGDKYESSGAAIRVAMNAVPAILFLIFRKRFQLTPQQQSFWTWISFSALLLVLALKLSPSSTAVDRIALYWIPLQLFVLSRLPNIFGKRDGKNALWVYAIAAYSALVLFVWLFFGEHSVYWLPYQFYPWVWLAQLFE